MNTAAAQPDPARRLRGRLQLIVLLLIAIGPMFVAQAMYKWRVGVPEGRTYHGELLGGGESQEQLGLGATPVGRWQIVVTAPGACSQDCERLVYLARQIHIGLNREAGRVQHVLATDASLSPDYTQRLQREYPQLLRVELDRKRYEQMTVPDGVSLWLVDPHGNLVLRYDAGSDGKSILDDLRYLLKVSLIG